jgi:hypothetical protein
LFHGTLGNWQDETYDITLRDNANPYHDIQIPKIHEATLKMELEWLYTIGVIKKTNQSEWRSSTFIIQKGRYSLIHFQLS